MVKMTHAKLIQIHGEWLDQFSWEWFGGFTFRDEVTEEQADQKWNKWVQTIESVVGNKISYIRVLKQSGIEDNFYYVALLKGLRGESFIYAQGKWRQVAGEAAILNYRKTGTAAYYISNSINPNFENVVYSSWPL